jgi:2-hydroxychromene-2-carboxylate isomerase
VTLTYDLYWSFRSPYSYLVTPRLVALERDYDVACNVRVVYPLAVRTPEFFDRDPLWLSYFMVDVFREAAFLGLPFRWPRPDPVQRDMQTGQYPKEQPYIHRLTHLGVAAAERGKGLYFLNEISALIWSGGTENWHEGDHLARATERAGLDYAELSAAVDGDPAYHVNVVEANQVAQRQAGHYGVPLMVFGAEPFFGQDRFDQMKWRMEQAGLTKR